MLTLKAVGYNVLGNTADPYDDCPAAAHGTSVTGVIGANRNETGFLGVAPDVRSLPMPRITADTDLPGDLGRQVKPLNPPVYLTL